MTQTTVMTKPLIIFHHPCDDGFGAALAAWIKFGENAEYCGREHQMAFDTLPSIDGREVYILDFSFKREQMQEIIERASSVTWLDHHKSAFEMWGVMDIIESYGRTAGEFSSGGTYILDNEKSGAVLAWEHFHGHVPALISHIDDNDRWQFKMESTKPFIRHLRSLEMSFYAWDGVLQYLKHSPINYLDFIATGVAIEKFYNKQVLDVLARTRRFINIVKFDETKGFGLPEIDGQWSGLSANVNGIFASDAGNILATESGTFGLTWDMRHDGLVRCSLRSVGNYDVSLIAVQFGGGGHRNAAAFSVSMEVLQSWLVNN